MGGKGGNLTGGTQNIINQLKYLGNQANQTGNWLTSQYAIPVLNSFMQILGLGGSSGVPITGMGGYLTGVPTGFASTPLQVGMMQQGKTSVPVYEYGGKLLYGKNPQKLQPYTGDPSQIAWGGGVQWHTGDMPATSPTSGSFMNPIASSLFQLPKYMAEGQFQQLADQLKSMPGLGPIASARNIENLRMQSNANMSAQAFGAVQGMLQSLLGQQNQWSVGAGLAGQDLSSAGGLQAQIMQMQNQAEMMGQYSMMQGLTGLMRLGGMLAGGPLGGQIGGALGNMLGSSGGGGQGISDIYGSTGGVPFWGMNFRTGGY